MTSKPDNLTPGAQYIYERTYERELRVDPINIPLTSELSNLIKGKSMTYKPYKMPNGEVTHNQIQYSTNGERLAQAEIKLKEKMRASLQSKVSEPGVLNNSSNPCAEIPLGIHDRQLLTAKEIMETQPMTEKGAMEIAYKYINEKRLAQIEIKSVGKIQTWDPKSRVYEYEKLPAGGITYQTEKGAPDGYISGHPVYRDEAGTLSYSGKSTGSPTATGYTEINPPPVAKEDLASTYNVYAETACPNYESLASQRLEELLGHRAEDKYVRKMENNESENEPYTPGYHNYEAYKPSLGKLDRQELNPIGTFAGADVSHMTRLERITAGLEKDPYVAHRNSYKGACEKGRDDGLAWATDLQKPKLTIGVQDQSGEEFEIWDSMSATYMNKK